MAIGPGKYDEYCTLIREKHGALGVIVIVAGGDRGEGFSCQLAPFMAKRMPEVLRHIAGQIEASLKSGEDTN